MGWWVAELLDSNPAMLVSWVVWVIVSIVLHELAHGVAAIRCGDRTPIELGHMTWNPVVHMGVQSLVIFAVIGIAWGAMPVTPSRFRGRHDDALVAFAGPATNIALAVLAVVLGGVWVRVGGFSGPTFYENLANFFYVGAGLNLVLAALNLLPIPPLDGSRIAASYSWRFREFLRQPQAAMIALIAIVAIFIWGGNLIFEYAFVAADWGLTTVAGLLGG